MYVQAVEHLAGCLPMPARPAESAQKREQIRFVELTDVKVGVSDGRYTASFRRAGAMPQDKRERFIKRFCDPILAHDLGRLVLLALKGGSYPVEIAWGNGQFGFTGTLATDPKGAVDGNGSGSVILIDEKGPDWIKLETIVRHPDVGFFHELVHALHNQSGASVNNEREMENRVIGIGDYTKCAVTENAYRKARDLPWRCCRDREQLSR